MAFGYESVAEHLAVISPDDYDETGTLLDPILSARTLAILTPPVSEPIQHARARVQRALTVIEKVLLRDNDITGVEFDLRHLDGSASLSWAERQLDWLQRRWRRLVEVDLPGASRTRSWPVDADHCFARILLDHSCGKPWRAAIAPPAWRNAPMETLITALLAGERVLSGDLDLHDLNRQSLMMRGKLR